MNATGFRVLFLAILLFLGLGQGCFAAPPGASWDGMTFERMDVDACVRWSGRALEEEGFNVQVMDRAIWATKDPYSALVLCHAAPTLTVIIMSNGGDAGSVRDAFERRIHEVVRHHGHDHWR